MKTSRLNLYFCPDCKSKYLESELGLTECPKCHSKLITEINQNTVQVVLNE